MEKNPERCLQICRCACGVTAYYDSCGTYAQHSLSRRVPCAASVAVTLPPIETVPRSAPVHTSVTRQDVTGDDDEEEEDGDEEEEEEKEIRSPIIKSNATLPFTPCCVPTLNNAHA